MEKIIKVGKSIETTLEEILYENKLSMDEIVYKKGEVKKSLFKGETTEVIVYKKADIINEIKNFLTEIIKGFNLDVKFEVRKVEDRTLIKMYSDNNSILIGHNGNTLRALETMCKQRVQSLTGIFFGITLDVENYKDKKNARLERLAKQTAKEVLRTKVEVHMENMNAYERRIVHNALSNFKNISSASEGEEPNRHIVISYKK